MTAVVPSRRFASLDLFRGLTVFLMIVVNTAGPGAPAFTQLVHAPWIGFTLADLVYPSFLFAMGSSLAFARLGEAAPGDFLVRVVRRTLLIFLLGFLMYWYPFTGPIGETRIPGVLQRIALCYLIAAPACRWLDGRGLVLLSIALLAAHGAALVIWSDAGQAFTKMGNAGTKLDLWLIGPSHLYRKDGGFDPEGLLGTLSATVNVIAGYLATRAIRRGVAMPRIAAIGALLIVAALACAPMLPIAKKLWTGSFVLLTVGIDLLILAVLVPLVERRPDRAAANPIVRFFATYGRNPLLIYLFSELLVMTLALLPGDPYRWVGINIFQRIAPGAVGSLLCAVAYALVCWLLGYWLDRRKLIVKL